MKKISLENLMAQNLKNSKKEDLLKAHSYIKEAIEIFELCGIKKAKENLNPILLKLAKKDKSDLDFVLNEFDSLYDDGGIDELLAADIEGEKRNYDSNIDMDFEDE